MRGTATLKKLDDYLRAIWLECCGHLSEFAVDGWGQGKMGMNRKALDAFNLSPQLTHIYDFGDTSQTLVTLVGLRQGHPLSKHPITLMARNVPPPVECQECEKPAMHWCQECQIEDDKPDLLCDEHTKSHPHENYGEPIPLVNSPRGGMCGYDGPAEPPY